MRELIPYESFTSFELSSSIRSAELAMQRLVLNGCARSDRSIEILRKNIHMMEVARRAIN